MSKKVTAQVNLTLYGQPVALQFAVPADKVTPLGVLPALQQIDNQFVDTAVAAFVGTDQAISCQAGCGACCRQVVPLAEFEAYHIAAVVERLPEPRRSAVKQRFADGCAQLDRIGWLEQLQQQLAQGATAETVQNHALDYFRQNIACPFLENESCSIHPERPLACREYLVTSPAEHCREPSPDTVNHIELKFQVSRLVRKLWHTGHITQPDSVPMIYALQWVKIHPNQFPKKRGPEWMQEFFDYLAKP